METISLKIPKSLALRLTQMAHSQNRSKSAVVREAVDIYLRSESAELGESVLDQVADLVGIFSGPGDLSTNKAYFEDFDR